MTRLAGITPLAAARAGTVNDAGGLTTDVSVAGYQSLLLTVNAGVVGTSCNCKLQDSATAGGVYADITGAAITAIPSAGPGSGQIACKITPGRNFVQIVMVTVGGTTVAGAELWGIHPQTTSRV
jgi:hypothetical protein